MILTYPFPLFVTAEGQLFEHDQPPSPAEPSPDHAPEPASPPASPEPAGAPAPSAGAAQVPPPEQPERREARPQAPRRQRGRRAAADEAGAREQLRTALANVQKAADQLEDDDLLFGQLVGRELKKLPADKKSSLRIKIMQMIHNSLYEA